MPTKWNIENDAYPPDWCIHYRAMSGPWNGREFEKTETCLAGVRYKDVEVVTDHLHMPCFFSDIHDPALKDKFHCAKMQYPTKEQVERYEAHLRETLERFQKELAADICPHCHKPIERYEQVGRCVYAHPCGDRLYQGKIPKGKVKA